MSPSIRPLLALSLATYAATATARGGSGSSNGAAILIGLGALVIFALFLSRVSGSTWRSIGGLLIALIVLTFIVQLLGA